MLLPTEPPFNECVMDHCCKNCIDLLSNFVFKPILNHFQIVLERILWWKSPMKYKWVSIKYRSDVVKHAWIRGKVTGFEKGYSAFEFSWFYCARIFSDPCCSIKFSESQFASSSDLLFTVFSKEFISEFDYYLHYFGIKNEFPFNFLNVKLKVIPLKIQNNEQLILGGNCLRQRLGKTNGNLCSHIFRAVLQILFKSLIFEEVLG